MLNLTPCFVSSTMQEAYILYDVINCCAMFCNSCYAIPCYVMLYVTRICHLYEVIIS